MKPSRMWMSGSLRRSFATAIVAPSSACSATVSVTPASESRSDSIEARSAGDWTRAVRRRSTPMPIHYTARCRGGMWGPPSEAGGEGGVQLRVTGRRLRDPDPNLQRQVVAHREIADELGAHRPQPREPRALADVPRVPGIAEYGQRQFVGAEREMPHRVADQRERDAILRGERRGATTAQLAGAVAAHRKCAKRADRGTVAELKRARCHTADRQVIADFAVKHADRTADREHRIREVDARAE